MNHLGMSSIVLKQLIYQTKPNNVTLWITSNEHIGYLTANFI